ARSWVSIRAFAVSGLQHGVAARRKLDQIKAIAKRVGHVRYLPILAILNLSIERCTGFQGTGNRLVKIRDDEVKMNRCPVSFVAAGYLLSSKVRNSGTIPEEKDRHVGP